MSNQSGPYPNGVPRVVGNELVRNDDPALARDMNVAYHAGWKARGSVDEKACRERAAACQTVVDDKSRISDKTTARFCVNVATICADNIAALDIVSGESEK